MLLLALKLVSFISPYVAKNKCDGKGIMQSQVFFSKSFKRVDLPYFLLPKFFTISTEMSWSSCWLTFFIMTGEPTHAEYQLLSKSELFICALFSAVTQQYKSTTVSKELLQSK